MSACYVFERVEKKYLLTSQKYEEFLKRIREYVECDRYDNYTICNIYYDTEQYELIRKSIERPKYKEKLRLRSYGIPKSINDTVFLEIKKKFNGVVNKRRISLTVKEAEDYLIKGIKPSIDSQIFREIDYFVNLYNPKPKMFIAYDRSAYTGIEDKSLRITFDRNIRSRSDNLNINSSDYGENILEDGDYLMEIKVSGAFPLWLVRVLSELEIFPISFSKYGNIYKENLISNKLLIAE